MVGVKMRLSKEQWLQGALEARCRGGVAAVRVEPLAAQLGVTKGSFYWHFKNRRELLLAVLGEWERLGTGAIIELVESGSDDPKAQLQALIATAFASEPQTDAIETAIRDWARSEALAAEATGRVDERRLEFVATRLRRLGLSPAKARRRGRLLYRTMIGEFHWRSSGGPGSTPKELKELLELLVAP